MTYEQDSSAKPIEFTTATSVENRPGGSGQYSERRSTVPIIGYSFVRSYIAALSSVVWSSPEPGDEEETLI